MTSPVSEVAYRKWAGQRPCLSCGGRAATHKYRVIPGGRRKPRPVLIRIIDGLPHEFDPGDRRYNGR